VAKKVLSLLVAMASVTGGDTHDAIEVKLDLQMSYSTLLMVIIITAFTVLLALHFAGVLDWDKDGWTVVEAPRPVVEEEKRARPEPRIDVVRTTTCDKMTQSQCTYKYHNAQPRFVYLAERDQGCW
jgi:hypothetical protein